MVIPRSNGNAGGASVLLAPLCGVTTAPFRRICLEHGADMVVTEMISSEAMTRGKAEDCKAIRGLDINQGPLSIQIFGGDPVRMGETAARLSELQPVFLDMNFGCPVKKIVNGNGGSAVLKDIDLLGRICREVVRRSSVPVSAKIRAGWDKPTGERVREYATVIEDAGVSMLSLHARTRSQGFSGVANWDLIAEAKRAVSIPVVGNGDVRSAADVLRMREHTGCDAVMIGRAAIGNPWVFDEVKTRLAGEDYTQPTPRERVDTMLRHVREAVRIDGEPGGVVAMRKVLAAYLKRLPNARTLRGRLMTVKLLAELEDVMSAYLAEAGPLADVPCGGEVSVEEFASEC
ncbi:MAG TPA: tRNA dihydrouridine synthase DusB [Candidatus Krumholzibacteria bacterium]|nr:tRNA dihydrouridine synthase DusB [Candidatus Krumholzibacteria bacterium]